MGETLADRIKNRMDALGIKQEKLGEKVGLSQVAIHKLLVGKSKSTKKLMAIAHVLGVRPEWLATGEEPMYPEDGLSPRARKVAEVFNNLSPENQETAWALFDAFAAKQCREKGPVDDPPGPDQAGKVA